MDLYYHEKTTIILSGDHLNIEDVVAVTRYHSVVRLADDESVRHRTNTSVDVIKNIVEKIYSLYRVITSFGGLGATKISEHSAAELQNNVVVALNMGAGPVLSVETVRAAMVLRANTHLIQALGIRRI